MTNENGIVRSFDMFKGYGFIRRKVGRDVFFFFEQVIDDDQVLDEGTAVSFIVKDEPRGPKAYEIRRTT